MISRFLKLVTLEFVSAALLCALSIAIFALLADETVIESEDIFDSRMFGFMSSLTSTTNTKIALFITIFGSGEFLIPAYALILFYFLKKRKYHVAAVIAVFSLISTVSGWMLKDIFHRARPLTPLIQGVGGYSFPSGHSLGGFTFVGVVIYMIFLSKVSLTGKWILAILSFLFGVLIGLSRIYLHVHFASDVLGSLFVALTWLCLSFIVLLQFQNFSEKRMIR